jgi:hypothetical protein
VFTKGAANTSMTNGINPSNLITASPLTRVRYPGTMLVAHATVCKRRRERPATAEDLAAKTRKP